MKAKMKLKLNNYPKDGWGALAGKPYLLNEFGTIYNIEDYYEKADNTMRKAVQYGNRVYYADTVEELIEALKLNHDVKVERW